MLGALPEPGVKLLLFLIWGFSVPLWSVFPPWGFLGFGLFSCFPFSPHSLWCPFLFGVGVLPFFPCYFFIMNRWFKRTVVLDGSGFAETVKVEDIASKIVEFFGSDNVLSVQFMPGRAIRVTFENESFAATIVRESSVTIDNVVCYVGGGVGLDRRMFWFFAIPSRRTLLRCGRNFLSKGRYTIFASELGLTWIMLWMVPGLFV